MRKVRSDRGRWGLVVGAFMALAVCGWTDATGSTVTGRITGTAIPSTGTGQAFVRAVNLETARVVAAGTDAAGRYRLTVTKGAFALFPTVITLSRLYSPRPTKVRVRRGQRKSVRLRAKASVARPIVTFREGAFTGATGTLSVLNKGLFQMLVTDLLAAQVPNCEITLVARDAFAMNAIQAELALSRSGLVDPATAIKSGRLITPTRGVRGRFTVNGGRMRIDAEVYKWSSGKTLSRTSVEGAEEEFFALEVDLARKLAALVCDQPPPITGTFGGSLDYLNVPPVGVVPGTLEWSGSLELEPVTSAGGIPPAFGAATTFYQATAGTVTARINVSPVGGNCGITGQGTFDVTTLSGNARPPVLSITDGNPDTYRLSLDAGLAQVPAVLTACPPGKESSNGQPAVWPLLGIGLLPLTTTPFAVETPGLFAGAATGSTPGLNAGYQWTWTLRG